MKARLLAVLLVSTLVLAVAAPLALAQVTVAGDNNTGVQYVDCSQVQAAVGVQYGNANAVAVVNSEATAEVAQELNITQNQANACLGGIDQGNGGGNDEDEAEDEATETEANSVEDGKDDVLAGTIPEADELPETGGPSLLALGLGLVLVAGGASLIRFRR